MKQATTIHVHASILLAFQVACKRRRITVSEEVQRLMRIQLLDWNEPVDVRLEEEEVSHG